jgi:hypothetical protein
MEVFITDNPELNESELLTRRMLLNCADEILLESKKEGKITLVRPDFSYKRLNARLSTPETQELLYRIATGKDVECQYDNRVINENTETIRSNAEKAITPKALTFQDLTGYAVETKNETYLQRAIIGTALALGVTRKEVERVINNYAQEQDITPNYLVFDKIATTPEEVTIVVRNQPYTYTSTSFGVKGLDPSTSREELESAIATQSDPELFDLLRLVKSKTRRLGGVNNTELVPATNVILESFRQSINVENQD